MRVLGPRVGVGLTTGSARMGVELGSCGGA